MKGNPFESQLERLARTLTEQFGVKVACQGDNAWTDGRQIVLPSVPEPISDDLERMMVGYLDHEMGHVAFSDFGVAEQFAKSHPGNEGLLNVIEDALIERRAMERWPGVRRNLDIMFRQIYGRVAQLIQQRGPFDRWRQGNSSSARRPRRTIRQRPAPERNGPAATDGGSGP